MSWRIVFTKQAQKDVKKLSIADLRKKAEELLEILHTNRQFAGASLPAGYLSVRGAADKAANLVG